MMFLVMRKRKRKEIFCIVKNQLLTDDKPTMRQQHVSSSRLFSSQVMFLWGVALLCCSTPMTLAFSPAVMSPLFVHNLPSSYYLSRLRTLGGNDYLGNVPGVSNNGVSSEQEASPSQPASSSTAQNNYVPASLYTSDSNDQRYSASDWLHNIKTLPRSSILKEIKAPVLTITIWSFLVSLIYQFFVNVGMTGAAQRMCLSSKPHSFLVSALGLLLVFRTNSAYQRFTEGRQIWERILSVSRNVSRMATLYEKELGVERKKRVFRLLSAFPYLLRHHIQPQCLEDCEKAKDAPFAILLNDSRRGLVRRKGAIPLRSGHECWVDRRSLPWCLFPDSALQKCANAANRPLWACDRLSREFTDVPYTPNFTSRERLSFLSHVDKLSQCIGECERIHQTAVPLNYARHSLRSLTLWLFSLPFCILSELGLLTGVVMGAIAWLLLGVYQIGYTIEDPFQGTLRLQVLCDAVYRDVMYTPSEKSSPRETAFELNEERKEWAILDGFDAYLVGAAP